MEDQRFKTMRHIEAVRNFINTCITGLILRGEDHDQSKLQSPEREIFDEFTPLLRGITYGSDEYRATMQKMLPAIKHHNAMNSHHPEHFKDGIRGMNLLDVIEMVCDWRAASLRHADGDVFKSLEINKERFGISDDLAAIMKNTFDYFNTVPTRHNAEES